MHLIVCLENRNGLAFNGRRLSRDAEVCRRILQLARGRRLWMNAATYKLFASLDTHPEVSEDFLEQAARGDVCFAETALPDMVRVESVSVFRWNRDYPSDVRFSPEESGFTLESTEEFVGNSHPRLTLEVYKR